MRALALLLLIVNLAYLGWATLIDVHEDVMPAASNNSQTDMQRLVLASERTSAVASAAALSKKNRDEQAVEAKQAPVIPVPESTAHCISVGPFQDLSSAAKATATLQSSGKTSRQRLEQGQLWVGYWVSIPGFAKRDEAEKAVAKLKQNGINDVYISLSGAEPESSNVVSLGVFKEAERAHRLLAEAKALGFPAQISDRTRSGSVYWVDVDFPNPEPNFDFASLGAQPGKIVRLEQRPCPAAAH